MEGEGGRGRKGGCRNAVLSLCIRERGRGGKGREGGTKGRERGPVMICSLWCFGVRFKRKWMKVEREGKGFCYHKGKGGTVVMVYVLSVLQV